METPNIQTARPESGWWMKLLMKIAAVEEDTLRLCPQRDRDNAGSVAIMMLFALCWQTGVYSVAGHMLFADPGEIRPGIIAVGFFIASFVMAMDSQMMIRTAWYAGGLEALKRGGLDVSGGTIPRVKALVFLGMRILLSAALAQLTAIFASLFFFAADIGSQLHTDYVRASGPLIIAATTLVNSEITRAADAAKAQSDRVAKLSLQVT